MYIQVLAIISLLPFVASAELLPPYFFTQSMAVDSSGAMYFAGSILAADAPTTPGVFQPRALSTDCGLLPLAAVQCTHGYVVKVAPSGDRVLWATYFGGEGADSVVKIAIAPDGNLLLAGNTTSKTLLLTGYQREPKAMFVAKLSAQGNALLAGTYFGGPAPVEFFRDRVGTMNVDAGGNVYLAGTAYSTPFPTTPGAYRREHVPPFVGVCGGAGDQFLAKFDANLSRLQFSTLAGTPGDDAAHDLVIARDGSLYLAGSDGVNRLCQHPMLTRFTADGSAVLYSVMRALGPTPTGGYQWP